MGQYNHQLHSDLSWMIDTTAYVNDFGAGEPTIPLVDHTFQPLSELLQLNTADTISDHPVNTTWSTTTANTTGVADFDKLHSTQDHEKHCEESLLDYDQFSLAECIPGTSTGLSYEGTVVDPSYIQEPPLLLKTSLNARVNSSYFEVPLQLECDSDMLQVFTLESSPSLFDRAEDFVSLPFGHFVGSPLWTASSAILGHSIDLSSLNFDSGPLSVDPEIGQGQAEVDVDDFQWLAEIPAPCLSETGLCIGELDRLDSTENSPSDIGHPTQTIVPGIWNFSSQPIQGMPAQFDCATAAGALFHSSLPLCALSQGEGSAPTSASNPSVNCTHRVDVQQRRLHCYTHGHFCSYPVSGIQRRGHETSSISHSRRYMSEMLTPSVIISHKRRRRLTPKESEYLMAQFRLNDRPTGQERDMFAKCLNLDRKTVQVWFQNRRAKLKRDVPHQFVCDSKREN